MIQQENNLLIGVQASVSNKQVLACKTHDKLVVVDGSFLEGGGQVIRSTLALSFTLQNQPILLHSIRAGRADKGGGGLKAQHLQSVRLAAQLSHRTLTNDFKGSTEILCEDNFNHGCGNELPGEIIADTGTAGSLTLILQAVLPPLLFASRGGAGGRRSQPQLPPILRLLGGTDVDFSPPVAHFTHVLAPLLRRMGADIDVQVLKRGFCPKGGGELLVKASFCSPSESDTDISSVATSSQNKLNTNSSVTNETSAAANADEKRQEIRDDCVLCPIRLVEHGEVCAVDGVVALSSGFSSEVADRLKEVLISFLKERFPSLNKVKIVVEGEGIVSGGSNKSASADPIYGADGNHGNSKQAAMSGSGGSSSGGGGGSVIGETCDHKQSKKMHASKKKSKKSKGVFSLQLAIQTTTGCILSCNSLRTHALADCDWIDKFVAVHIGEKLDHLFKIEEEEEEKGKKGSEEYPSSQAEVVDGRGEEETRASGGITKIIANNKNSSSNKSNKLACVDEHTADQLIVWMALAKGRSQIVAPSKRRQTSQHLETVIHFTQKLTGANFTVEEQEDHNTMTITCDGIGWGGEGFAGQRWEGEGS